MKIRNRMKPWIIAGLVAIFVSACATTQEEIADGPPIDDQAGMADDGSITGGADATGISDDMTGEGTAIAGGDSMNAIEMLEQTEGALASRTIYFEFDSAKLSSESIQILETHGSFIAGNGVVSVRLEGHADERGSREYNIALGDRRAQSVRRVLMFQGASSDQLDTVSYGEEQPAMLGHTEEAWSKNRRVELIYTVN